MIGFSQGRDSLESKSEIILMDGNCGLCSHLGRFLKAKIRKKFHVKILAIESPEGSNLISQFPKKLRDIDSLFLLTNGKIFTKSGASIRILLYLGWPYKVWFPLFWLVPYPFRDLVYNFIAKYRHSIFARPEKCTF